MNAFEYEFEFLMAAILEAKATLTISGEGLVVEIPGCFKWLENGYAPNNLRKATIGLQGHCRYKHIEGKECNTPIVA